MLGKINLQNLMNSRTAGIAAYTLCQVLPPAVGYRLAGRIARRVAAQRQTPFVQALRSNQWVVQGEHLISPQLDQAVEMCVEALARAFYQLFHYWRHPPAFQALVEESGTLQEIIESSQKRKHGVLVTGLHMAGFDLIMQIAAQRGLRGAALSLPDANPTVEWQHRFRRESGLEILAPTVANLRRMIDGLCQGELAITGIDRPLPESKYRPVFFGRPAALPTHHITLALKAGVPIVVMGVEYGADGRYHLLTSDEIYLRPYTDRTREMVCNAEMVLEAAQEILSHAPEQWTMPHAVWPEVSAKLAAQESN